jgi:hypothetical protein
MTPQEQDLLKGLTDRINQTQLTDKDPEAEQFIQQSLGRNPDATYILAQTVLVQQYALDNATRQLNDLKEQAQRAQQQAQQPVKHTSFLGSLLGQDDPPPPPPTPQYQPVQTYAQPVSYGYAQPAYGSPVMGGQGGGFLRGAMQTAAGVAAGALAFEGVESLMHGFGEHAGYGSGFDGGMGGGHPEEIINNNYYGDSSPGSENRSGDLTDRFADAGDQPSPDVEDRRDDSQADFADTGNQGDSTDNFADDSSTDDSGGGFDESGSSSDDGGF